MCLISGCLCPTQLTWLPVLTNVAPPSQAATDDWQHASNHRSSPKLAHTCRCLWASTSTACIPTPNMVRHGTCQHNYAVERGLAVGFCGQPLYCNWPYYLTTRFWSPSSHMVSAQLFMDRPRPMSCKCAQIGSCPITFLWLWPATDHEPRSWYVPTNNIWRRTETTLRSRWWRSHMAGINGDHSTREIEMNWCSETACHLWCRNRQGLEIFVEPPWHLIRNLESVFLWCDAVCPFFMFKFSEYVFCKAVITVPDSAELSSWVELCSVGLGGVGGILQTIVY